MSYKTNSGFFHRPLCTSSQNLLWKTVEYFRELAMSRSTELKITWRRKFCLERVLQQIAVTKIFVYVWDYFSRKFSMLRYVVHRTILQECEPTFLARQSSHFIAHYLSVLPKTPWQGTVLTIVWLLLSVLSCDPYLRKSPNKQ